MAGAAGLSSSDKDGIESVRALGCPVLVATGEHDAVVKPEALREQYAPLLSGNGNGDVHVFEDCGHLPHEECPADVVDVLTHFIAGQQD